MYSYYVYVEGQRKPSATHSSNFIASDRCRLSFALPSNASVSYSQACNWSHFTVIVDRCHYCPSTLYSTAMPLSRKLTTWYGLTLNSTHVVKYETSNSTKSTRKESDSESSIGVPRPVSTIFYTSANNSRHSVPSGRPAVRQANRCPNTISLEQLVEGFQ